MKITALGDQGKDGLLISQSDETIYHNISKCVYVSFGVPKEEYAKFSKVIICFGGLHGKDLSELSEDVRQKIFITNYSAWIDEDIYKHQNEAIEKHKLRGFLPKDGTISL